MRYFHRGWADGELSDLEYERTQAAYEDRLAEISPRLTADLMTLAGADLNDALIEHIEWAPSIRRLVLELVVGSNQAGYSIMRLTFRDALLGEHRQETLRDLGRDRRVEMLAHEVDLDQVGALEDIEQDQTPASGYTVRMLFWPTYELTIDFAALELETRPAPGRLISPGDAYVELHREDPEDEAEVVQVSS